MGDLSGLYTAYNTNLVSAMSAAVQQQYYGLATTTAGSGTITVDYGGILGTATVAAPKKASSPNLDWLDERVNAMRVKL